MGLDMFFTARKYLSNYKRENEKEYAPELKKFNDTNYMFKEYEIGYFRKFNALHNYIVENFADGVDDCRPIFLYENECKQILSKLEYVQKNKSEASDILPTHKGFFFGSQDYDEWYYKDIDDAVNLFTNILDLISNYDYEIVYKASW